MSDPIHPTRLRWDGYKGVARHDGVEVIFHERPAGLRYHDIDYEPGAVAQVRDRACDVPRTLEPREIDAVIETLRRIARVARSAL